MSIEVVPEWMVDLDDEDVAFVKRFLLASGSLKEVARQYGVTIQRSDCGSTGSSRRSG